MLAGIVKFKGRRLKAGKVANTQRTIHRSGKHGQKIYRA